MLDTVRTLARAIRRLALPVVALLITCPITHGAHSEEPALQVPSSPLLFSRDVRPILSNNCFKCHGPDEQTRQAGLRLDTRDGALEAIRAGNPDASLLIRRIETSDESERMPPPEVSTHGLSDPQIAVLRRWISEGVTWSEHWSFVPPVRSDPPPPSNPAWPRRPLDNWVLASLTDAGLEPSPEADRRTLIRRVSLDLIGLPPTPEETDAFVNDASPDAYERVVDRLLASPRFGEKWARWWLDLARYADTKGYEKDDRRTMWPYRDWVIRALNDGIPFDRFSLLQLAGDLQAEPTTDDLVATAFHRNTMTNDEGGTDDEEYRTAAVIDRVNTTMEIWQGLTMGCAQCHTHKYDPITHTDYFAFAAIFNNTEDADRYPVESPVLPLPSDEQRSKIDALNAEIARLQAAAETEPALAKDLEPQLAEQRKQLGDLQNAVIKIPIMRELQGDQRRTTHRLSGGSHLAPQEAVQPGIPAMLAGVSESNPTNRHELAAWLFDPDNPLTARVIVNRVWEQLWGEGLVTTLEDFGTQGAWPTHSELLDSLAIAFRDGTYSDATSPHPWDFKRLLRELVTSSTYRQSSASSQGSYADDPANLRLARGPRLRLDAETIRDQVLAASGLLSSKMYGPSVFPYQPDGLWIMIYSGDRWNQSTGEDAHRRSLYTFIRRTVPHPAMTTFDAPSREVCISRRIRTNTPLQAMVTLNDPQFVEASQGLARLAIRAHVDDASRAAFIMQRVLCRPPTADELAAMLHSLAFLRTRYADSPDDALAAATEPLGPLDPAIPPSEAASWSVLASVILNLDEALTKE
ncbi:MAG: PSD1 domain-containing protein [Phycisphaeraceae bacterium]|nr:MAG: PSD1 domain-containing protein [Phycisphaeraceae bacterium]